jgi:hypothetical protein
MEISVDQAVPFPRELVFRTVRDHLPDLAPLLSNVDKIDCEEREDLEDGTTRFLNIWHVSHTEVPKLLRPFVPAERLKWVDTALWTEEGWQCDWNFDVGFMSKRVTCKGINYYVEKDDGNAVIQVRGRLDIDMKGMAPGFVIKRVRPRLERFLVHEIEPNFVKLALAVHDYLSDKDKG